MRRQTPSARLFHLFRNSSSPPSGSDRDKSSTAAPPPARVLTARFGRYIRTVRTTIKSRPALLPRISPDGNYLAFKRKHSATTDANNNYGLWILNLTTGAESEIFYQGDFLVGFDFTPDSLKIVFDHFCNVRQINIDGTGLLTLSSASCFDDAPTPRASDGRLAFHSQNGGIFTSNANGSSRAAVPNTGSQRLLSGVVKRRSVYRLHSLRRLKSASVYSATISTKSNRTARAKCCSKI